MKKRIAALLAASFVLSASSAFAAELLPNPAGIKFDGSVSLQYRNDSKPNTPTYNGLKWTTVLNAEKNIFENVDLYARMSYQYLDNQAEQGGMGDYINDGYNGGIDAFGLKIKSGGFNYVIGSQSLTIGSGLIYDNGFIGKHALPYAFKMSGKMGATDVSAFYAKTNYQGGLDNDKIYAVEGKYALNDKTTIGALYAHASYGTDNSTAVGASSANFYGLNGSVKLTDKLNFSAEFVKSNASADNKGYIGSFGYAADAKNSFGFSYYRSEDLSNVRDANFGGMTTAPNANTKGYIVSWNHKLGSNVSFGVSYDSYKIINATAKTGTASDRDRTKVGVTVAF